MNLKTFINRPVLSTVISIILVILGILGLSSLPITQYPDVAPPTIQVSATYTGANAETVLNSVIAPLEEQINGVEGMTYMTSTASNDGSASITVYFALGHKCGHGGGKRTEPRVAGIQPSSAGSYKSGCDHAEAYDQYAYGFHHIQ